MQGIISSLIISLSLLWVGYKLSKSIILLSESLRENMNKEKDNVRSTTKEKLSAGTGEFKKEPNTKSEDMHDFKAGVKAEDFCHIVSNVSETAVSFGEDVED